MAHINAGSIDSLLEGGAPMPPPQNIEEPKPTEKVSHETIPDIYSDEPKQLTNELENDSDINELEEVDDEEQLTKAENETDDYGNEKQKAKTYTQEELDEYARQMANKAVRERLERMERNQARPQEPNRQPTQAGQDEGWEGQLESFIENTLSKVSQKQAAKQFQEQEAREEAEYNMKFHHGKSQFNDFDSVVGQMPITDAMVLATRGLSNPAAFFYAASKREPAELERIAKITSPYQQIREIGRLEERMKKKTTGTSAPKPVSRTPEDATIAPKKKAKAPSIEDMIRQDAERRIQMKNARRGR